MHYDTGSYFANCEEKIVVDEVIFSSTIAANSPFIYMRCNSNG